MLTDEDEVRAIARDLYDEISIPALATVPPEQMDKYRQLFAEGYLQGYARGATQILEELLPKAPDYPPTSP